MKIRKATVEDAAVLAELIDLAGEGIPAYLWQQMAEPGQSAAEVGASRAAREAGGFSYRNASVIDVDGQVAAMLLGYQQDDPYSLDDIDDYPALVRPLVELEDLAPGSWYVNALAVYPAFRRQGLAAGLLQEAERLALAQSIDELSLIVASENRGAVALYQSLGYEHTASRPLVDYPGAPHGGDWWLMVKRLSSRARG